MLIHQVFTIEVADRRHHDKLTFEAMTKVFFFSKAKDMTKVAKESIQSNFKAVPEVSEITQPIGVTKATDYSASANRNVY